MLEPNQLTAAGSAEEACLLIHEPVWNWIVHGSDASIEETIPVWMKLLESLKVNETLFNELSSYLLDLLWLMDLQVTEAPNASVKERLTAFTRGLYDYELVTWESFCERLEAPFLETLELIRSQASWTRKAVKFNTAMLYRQQKFNLLREESEGYGKLIYEVYARLQQLDKDNIEVEVEQFQRTIHSLVGFFDLDPNRVNDLLLDEFSETLSDDIAVAFFIELFKRLPWNDGSLWATLLGFKFKFYSQKSAPKQLYEAAAQLIKHDLISVPDLYPHLSPDDSEMEEIYNQLKAKCQNEVKQLSKAIISGSKTNEENEVVKDNQKARLCGTLLMCGLINEAMTIIGRYPNLCACEPRLIPLLSHHLHWLIEPLYHPLRPKGCLPRNKMEMDPFSPSSKVNSEIDSAQCQAWDDFFDLVLPKLDLIGPRLHHDIYLATKLCRLAQSAPKEHVDQMLGLLVRFILPALSQSQGNIGLSNEIWNWLKNMPYQKRYTIYGEWKNKQYEASPEMQVLRAQTVKETKRIMRRISKDNMKQYGRSLAKVSHSNPAICFTTVLDQLQVYENLIGPMVEVLRYSSELSFDVLSFILIEYLADPTKTRLKPDGTNLALWLNSLADFSGHLFRRYPNIELTGLLFYVYYQIRDGNPFDLVIIKELVTKMSGIEQLLQGASEHQLQAMAGGETLKTEAITYGQFRNMKKPTLRLIQALMNADLASAFAIIIGRQLSTCVFHEGIDHLKLLSSLYDQIHETFLHFVDFMAANIESENYQLIIPGVMKLIRFHKLEAEVAWYLVRPTLRSKPVVEMLSEGSGQDMVQMKQDPRWPDLFIKTIDDVEKDFVPNIWETMSTRFYVTFWTLTLYDIFIPKERYEAEIQKQKNLIADIQKDPSTLMKRKKDVERAQATLSALEKEYRDQERNLNEKKMLLHADKDNWFLCSNNRQATALSLLQHCFRPRIFFSANDASYCARLLFQLQELGTLNFSTLSVIDHIFSDAQRTLFMCTQNEAMYYGRFMTELLSQLSIWLQKEDVYKAEVEHEARPGFRRKWNVAPADSKVLDFSSYRIVLFKWHTRLFKAVMKCFESKEYMRTRNCILVLDQTAVFFPSVDVMGQQLERRVKQLIEGEQREDLKVLLNRYNASLTRYHPTWISREAFQGLEPLPLPTKEDVKSAEVPSSDVAGAAAGEMKKEKEKEKEKMVEELEEGEHRDDDHGVPKRPPPVAESPIPPKRRKVGGRSRSRSRSPSRSRRRVDRKAPPQQEEPTKRLRLNPNATDAIQSILGGQQSGTTAGGRGRGPRSSAVRDTKPTETNSRTSGSREGDSPARDLRDRRRRPAADEGSHKREPVARRSVDDPHDGRGGGVRGDDQKGGAANATEAEKETKTLPVTAAPLAKKEERSTQQQQQQPKDDVKQKETENVSATNERPRREERLSSQRGSVASEGDVKLSAAPEPSRRAEEARKVSPATAADVQSAGNREVPSVPSAESRNSVNEPRRGFSNNNTSQSSYRYNNNNNNHHSGSMNTRPFVRNDQRRPDTFRDNRYSRRNDSQQPAAARRDGFNPSGAASSTGNPDRNPDRNPERNQGGWEDTTHSHQRPHSSGGRPALNHHRRSEHDSFQRRTFQQNQQQPPPQQQNRDRRPPPSQPGCR